MMAAGKIRRESQPDAQSVATGRPFAKSFVGLSNRRSATGRTALVYYTNNTEVSVG